MALAFQTITVTESNGPQPISNPPSHLVTVHVHGSTFDGKEVSRVTRSVQVTADTTITVLIDMIRNIKDGHRFPDDIREFGQPNDTRSIGSKFINTIKQYTTHDVTVTDQPSNWAQPSILSPSRAPSVINIHDTFVRFWSRINCPTEDYISKLDRKKNAILYQNMEITLQRTVKIPNDGQRHYLPAGLGPLPLVNVSNYSKSLPEYVCQKGGLLVPMYHSEALWMSFEEQEGAPLRTRPVAARMYVGGVNGISGEPSHGMQNLLSGKMQYIVEPLAKKQDYVVTPEQASIYGVVIGDEEVRQLVATPLCSNTTIESQMTGRDAIGGLQLELIPSYDTSCTVVAPGVDAPSCFDTPASLNIQPGTTVQLRGTPQLISKNYVNYTVADYQELFGSNGSTLSIHINRSKILYVQTLIGEPLAFEIPELGNTLVCELKEMIRERLGILHKQQQITFAGRYLLNGAKLADYNIQYESTIHLVLRLRGGGQGPIPPQLMGLGAGGKVYQFILEDKYDRRIWDLEAASAINFQILNALDFSKVTNMIPPPTPIHVETYNRLGLPWHQDYFEDVGALKDMDGAHWFKNLRTIDRTAQAAMEDLLELGLGSDIINHRYISCQKPVLDSRNSRDRSSPSRPLSTVPSLRGEWGGPSTSSSNMFVDLIGSSRQSLHSSGPIMPQIEENQAVQREPSPMPDGEAEYIQLAEASDGRAASPAPLADVQATPVETEQPESPLEAERRPTRRGERRRTTNHKAEATSSVSKGRKRTREASESSESTAEPQGPPNPKRPRASTVG